MRLRTFQVRRTSNQWNAYPQFHYCVEFHRNSFHEAVREFNKAIQWCWETYGASLDLQSWKVLRKSDEVNTLWCWENQTNVHANRIYFASSKEVDAFLLKWN